MRRLKIVTKSAVGIRRKNKKYMEVITRDKTTAIKTKDYLRLLEAVEALHI